MFFNLFMIVKCTINKQDIEQEIPIGNINEADKNRSDIFFLSIFFDWTAKIPVFEKKNKGKNENIFLSKNMMKKNNNRRNETH
jgi:hypothetical protein